MTKKISTAGGTIQTQEVITMSEYRPARLMNLPLTVKGFCYHDDDGEAFVVLNARWSREQNRRTYDHETGHIDRGEMYEPEYIEYKEEEP